MATAATVASFLQSNLQKSQDKAQQHREQEKQGGGGAAPESKCRQNAVKDETVRHQGGGSGKVATC